VTGRVHLVLSSGGARVLAYAGAIQALEAADVEIASLAGCSAGAVIGALAAAGWPGKRIAQLAIDTELKRYVPPVPVLSRIRALRRWPFAVRGPLQLADLVSDAIGSSVTFAGLPKPFATIGVDLISGDHLVYSRITHPDMLVGDAVRIATALPFAYPPHVSGRRMVFDASIATYSPAWLSAAAAPLFDEALPVVLLRFQPARQVVTPRRIDQFIRRLMQAAIQGRDALMIRGDSRVIVIDLPVADVSAFQFDLNRSERMRLVDLGRDTTQRAVDAMDGDFAGESLRGRAAESYVLSPPPSDAGFDDRAAWAGAHYAQRFLHDRPPEIFVSYAHEDQRWFDRIVERVRARVTNPSTAIWSDRDIPAGAEWGNAISEAISRARVALLIVSRAYLRSEFIGLQEFPALIEAGRKHRVRLVWVLASDCDWQGSPLRSVQAAFPTDVPLDSLPDDDLEQALSAIGDAVAGVL